MSAACDGGRYPGGASPYGALDMAGNAIERVADRVAADHYAASAARNPQGPDSGIFKVARGGSWATDEVSAADRRVVGLPTDPDVDFGFRCAASP